MVMLSHGQGFVFGGFHSCTLPGAFVIQAAEMQDAVNNHTVQLFVIGSSEQVGIGEDSVERDIQVAVQHLPFGIVEGDDVCVIVMAEKFVVHLEYLVVVHEQIADFTDFLAIRSCHLPDPVGGISLLDIGLTAGILLIPDGVLCIVNGILTKVRDARAYKKLPDVPPQQTEE